MNSKLASFLRKIEGENFPQKTSFSISKMKVYERFVYQNFGIHNLDGVRSYYRRTVHHLRQNSFVAYSNQSKIFEY